MNLETLKPLETYKYSKERYSLIRDQVLTLLKEYEHKDRISILFEYWLWNIRIIFLIYGKSGLREFLKSNIPNPSRFSVLKDTNNVDNPVLEIRSNKYLFYLLTIIFQNLLFQGAHLKTYRKKILGRISGWLLKSIPIKKDLDLRREITRLSMDYLSDIDIDELEELICKKLPIIFFTKPINFSFSFQSIKLECAAACFLEFHNYENIFLLNKQIDLRGLQHGGGYDTFSIDYFADYEKSLCDKFIGWGLNDFNEKQPKFQKFSNKESDQSLEKRIIWIEDSYLPSFYYMIMPYHHYQSRDIKSTTYIYKEIRELGFKFYNLAHPVAPSEKYAAYRGKLLDRSNNKGESLFLPKDIGIFDNSGATLIHFFVENEMPFIQVIDRSDLDRFTLKQREWFKVLYDEELAFYNDEVGRLTLGLKKIIEKNYSLPKNVADYHKRVFRSNLGSF